MLDDIQTSLSENKKLVAIAGVLVLIVVVGIFALSFTNLPDEDPTPTETPTATEEPFEPYPVNTSQLLASHESKLVESQSHQIVLTATIEGETRYTSKTTVSSDIVYSTRVDAAQGTNELWNENGETYGYDAKSGNVTELSSPLLDDRKSSSRFVQRIFMTGEYWYTNDASFKLKNITDTQSLLYAYPTISGQANGNVTDVSITGTVEDGVVTHMIGQFTYTPPYDGAESYTYEFELTVVESFEPIDRPSWVPIEEPTPTPTQTPTPTPTNSTTTTNSTNTTNSTTTTNSTNTTNSTTTSS